MKRFLIITLAFLSVSTLSVSMAQRRPNEAIPLPEYYGFYLVNNGKLCGIGSKVNGCPFRSETITVGTVTQSNPDEPGFTSKEVWAMDMSKGVRFINYQEMFSSQLGEMKLVPMLYIRNINVDHPQTETIDKSGIENAWDSGEYWIIEDVRNKGYEMTQPINFLIKPLKNNMVLGVPDRELTPGLYRITRDRMLIEHTYFWVGDPEKARAVKCVDATYTIDYGGVFKARFEPCGAEINEKGNSNSAAANRIFRPSEVDSKARILSRPKPTYPDEDRKNQVSGTVVLRGVFSKGGTVTNLRVVSGLTDAINAMCLKAARQIKFAPATKNGLTVSQYIQIEYNFQPSLN